MIRTATLGFPRIGPRRELKQALEAHWAGRLDEAGLRRAATDLRRARWLRQRHHGIAVVPCNDFSLYDHVLDTCCLVGAVPPRFGHGNGPVDLATYFRMARGGDGVPALALTKWFDTNYHHLVPELSAATRFAVDASKPLQELAEAHALGLDSRPVLIGPVSFLLLARRSDGRALDLLPALLPVYAAVLRDLAAAGASWVQVDEPCLAGDLDHAALAAYATAYGALAAAGPRLLLATYFGGIADHLATVAALPVHGLHVDLVRAPEQLPAVLAAWPDERLLSLGVVDGRNVWRCELDRALALMRTAARRRGELHIAPSCPLLHLPLDAAEERALDPQVAPCLAFAVQKLDEIAVIAAGALGGDAAIAAELERSRALRAARTAPDPAVRARAGAVVDADLRRRSPFAVRQGAQRAALPLPSFPTTTIGSFPQTAGVRTQRAAFRAGRLDAAAYDAFLRAETARCLRAQEDAGLDLLVHGEFERTDMVEHFAERLAGCLVTAHGWVQSYGSRCVKPPIIAGDVHRPAPLTVDWARFAQSCTARPVKGMLTGPVTIMQWSFVRDDLPRADVCRQIALALRDEVADLEAAGVPVIQVDEPALREGLPLRRRDHAAYLAWAVDAFRLATAGVADRTQIHTHMCYGDFADIMAAIVALDADVISIEAARAAAGDAHCAHDACAHSPPPADGDLIAALAAARYPNAVGPGVYDVHSPMVPTVEAMYGRLRRSARVLAADRLWVNPDCGLKTRSWGEVLPALANLVAAARRMRADSQ